MNPWKQEADMIAGALVREINATTVWAHMVEAAHALIHVRLQEKNHEREGAILVAGGGSKVAPQKEDLI